LAWKVRQERGSLLSLSLPSRGYISEPASWADEAETSERAKILIIEDDRTAFPNRITTYLFRVRAYSAITGSCPCKRLRAPNQAITWIADDNPPAVGNLLLQLKNDPRTAIFQ